MPDQPKPALHQFADDLAEVLKSPRFATKTFAEAVAECLDPLIDWRAADYCPRIRGTREEPEEPAHFETFEPSEEWMEDILNSLPKSVREDITERAHERALRNRGE